MLRNRKYKNTLSLRDNPDPKERRTNLTKEVLKNGSFFPNPVSYEDIDQAMMNWSNTALDLSFEGSRLTTMALYTNQRFEEYMQEWEHSDEKKNLLMNFKTITRENNPKKGTINGDGSSNIPGDRHYTIHREEIIDRNGQSSYIDYRMKQPFAVDLTYKICLITAKYELLNMFNTLCQDIFKSGYSYLNVNGHYLYMKMEDPSDDSEYALDDKRYFSQTIQILVKAYIIQKEDFIIEERPKIKLHISEGNTNVSVETLEDEESVVEVGNLYYKPLSLKVNFEKCDWNEVATRIPNKLVVKKIETSNIKSYKIYIDGEEVIFKDPEKDGFLFEFEEATLTKIIIRRENPMKNAWILFDGYDKDVIYTEDELDLSSEEDYLEI